MKLINVRLAPDDARRAAHLKQHGIRLSSVVRDAIRGAYDQQVRRTGRGQRPSALMKAIYRDVPDRGERRRGTYDLREGTSIRRVIVARLRRRSS